MRVRLASVELVQRVTENDNMRCFTRVSVEPFVNRVECCFKERAMTIACSVVAKSHVLYSGDLHSIVLPGVEGYLGIQENHEPFMTYLVDGIMWGRVRDSQGCIFQ